MIIIFGDVKSAVLAARQQSPSCIIFATSKSESEAPQFLDEMNAKNYAAPIIVLSNNGDVPTAVAAIKHGACDFLEQKTEIHTIVERVRQSIAVWPSELATPAQAIPDYFPGRELLTARELEVLSWIVAGASNWKVAEQLMISKRTVEIHRARFMQKLGARNSVELVHIVVTGCPPVVRR